MKGNKRTNPEEEEYQLPNLLPICKS